MRQKSILSHDRRVTALQRAAVYATQALALAGATTTLFAPDPYAHIGAAVAVLTSGISLLVGVLYGGRAVEEFMEQRALIDDVHNNRAQVQELFAMTDMLQAAEDHEDAGAILMATSQRLLPDFAGALYVFNNSRDRLDLAKSWNTSESFNPGETLLPSNCWALKRGKPHINDPNHDTLCCMHAINSAASVDVPMMARGQVYGLLVLAYDGDDSYEKLMDVRRVGRALADSMSLALSNISLREKLRSQSLRDPLTGLYNRRYMEDALERYIGLAERTGNATSVLMIDLDNFKRLNDEHGHSKGDAVLRDVATQLVAALRPADVVARYGGEELIVILPNCGLDDAEHKAEMLRVRVEGLTEIHGAAISASIGIATVPETSTSAADIIPMADAALYAAKKAGKNRVVRCDRRAERKDPKDTPRLAVTK